MVQRIARYVVERRAAAGAMGVLYAARDEALGRRVAIKVVQPELDDGEEGSQRLVREAQALAQLSHPNIVPVYEVGRHEGKVYLVMEYVRGTTLREWSAAERTWEATLDVYAQAAEGLEAVHAAGIVHRDVKPANIMVAEGGRTLLIDFGLACAETARSSVSEEPLFDASTDLKLTRPGAVMGTPAYMAPEVLRGAPADARSDQFSFCVSLYEALYRRRPFGGSSDLMSVLRSIDGDVLPPPDDVRAPTWLWAVVARGLEAAPADRFDSMRALSDEVARLRSPRRYLPVAGFGLATAGVAALAMWPEAEVAQCDATGGELEEAWGDTRRGAVRRAFSDMKAPFASTTLRTVEADLDAYAQRWQAAYVEACNAAGAEFDRRRRCLAERRAELGALTALLDSADVDVAKHAPRAVARLPSIESCTDPQANAKLPDAEIEADVEEARERLAEAGALASAEQNKRSASVAREVLVLAEDLGFLPLQTEAELRVAIPLYKDAELAEAREFFRSAYFHATSIDDGKLATEASTRLINVCKDLGDYDEARSWARHSRAQLDGESVEHPRQELRLATNLAELARAEGRIDEARDRYEAALEFATVRWGPDSERTTDARDGVARVAMWQGRWGDAFREFERLHKILSERYGATHPQTVNIRGSMGFALLKHGDINAAREILQEVVRRTEALVGPDSLDLATPLNNLAGAYERNNDLEPAREAFERVYEIRKKGLGPDHELTAHPLNNLGNVLADAEKYDEARQYYERALAILEGALGSDHPHVSFPVSGLGRVAAAQGRHAEAAAFYLRVVEIRERAKMAPEEVELARYYAVRSLWEIPARRPEAVQIANATAARLAAVAEGGHDLDELRRDVAEFLDEAREAGVSPGVHR